MAALPATTAHLRVLRQCFQDQCVEGEVAAGGFQWQFYWALWPAKGWQRLLPTGLRLPPTELDAIAALVMAEDHLRQRCSWPGPPPNFSLRTWPEP